LDAVSTSLRRPGRFDLEVELGVPDVKSREEILRVYLSGGEHQLSSQEIQLVARVIYKKRI